MARSGKIPFSVKFSFGIGQIGEAAFSSITLTFVSLLIILGCCFVVIGIFVRVFGTRKEIPHLDQASDDMPRFGLFAVIRDISQICQNRNYLFLLLAM